MIFSFLIFRKEKLRFISRTGYLIYSLHFIADKNRDIKALLQKRSLYFVKDLIPEGIPKLGYFDRTYNFFFSTEVTIKCGVY